MELKELRIKNNLTQKDLAQKANVSLRTIQTYEQHKRDLKKANVQIVYKLAKTLNVTVDELIHEEKKIVYYLSIKENKEKYFFETQRINKKDELIIFINPTLSKRAKNAIQSLNCKTTIIKTNDSTENNFQIATDLGIKIGMNKNEKYIIFSENEELKASIEYIKTQNKNVHIDIKEY